MRTRKCLTWAQKPAPTSTWSFKALPVQPHNVYIADICASVVEEGRDKFGFVPVVIDESGQLPFEDGFFDIVYCSSVIEHVTVPKEEVWSLKSGRAFKKQSLQRQEVFAVEVQRLGKQYFVQTPYRHFPIESHTLLPFAGWLPRPVLVPLLKFTNRFWLKQTSPDWHLLNKREMGALFQDAHIVTEKSCFITNSPSWRSKSVPDDWVVARLERLGVRLASSPEHPLIHAHGVLLYIVAMCRVVAHIDQALLIDSVAARHRPNATRNTVTSAGFTPANRAA